MFSHRTFLVSAAFIAVLAVPLALFSCSQPIVPLPEGVQTISGLLKLTEFSLQRRGTHLLLQQDTPLYYVESSIVNLRGLEGKEVTLQGLLEYNSDPKALPVLVVQRVVRGADEELRTWTVPSMSVSIAVPRSWKGTIQPGSAIFRASGSTMPLLRLGEETTAVLPFNFQAVTTSRASLRLQPLVIGSQKAVAALGMVPNAWHVYMDLGPLKGNAKERVILTMAFALDPLLTEESQIPSLLRIAQTAAILTNSSAPRSGTGVSMGTGDPCGGPAGILCPAGFYCQITDAETDSGRCKK